MATGRMGHIVQHLREAVLLGDGVGSSDGELLEKYLTCGDGAALAALVRRHGPMVWGVCRRVLRHEQDAEDAFQATFLVLARKAASVWPREMVGSWLYGVASRTATKARAMAARNRARERESIDRLRAEGGRPDGPNDLRALVEQEVGRLPDKYRVVVVLCDLEGKGRKEAAQQLGWPEGTVAGRLARARAMLGRRLARHGLGATGALAVLSADVASAGVPASLVPTTLEAVRGVATGQAVGSISAPVLALADAALPSLRPFGRALAATVLLLAFGGGLALLYRQEKAAGRAEIVAVVAGPAEAAPPAGEKARAGPAPAPPLDLHALLRLHLRGLHALLMKLHGPVREKK